jgi:hypothetical protein
MEDFLKNFVDGNRIQPPKVCLNAFNEKFGGSINVDWYEKPNRYEAIFYKDNLEHIAIFTTSGEMTEYKMYLPPSFLPEAIKSSLETKGEIMNSVLKNKGNRIEYEAIIRDTNLIRYLIILTDLGKVIRERQL